MTIEGIKPIYKGSSVRRQIYYYFYENKKYLNQYHINVAGIVLKKNENLAD